MGPNELRQKAEQCRRLARQPFQRRSSRGGGAYLLELATKFEREAAQLETRMAGNKPAQSESRPADTARAAVDPGPLVGAPHKD
jgi:hypothetical protein